MMKPQCLKKGDKIAIVSLSKGLLGEPFIQHELELGLKRLSEYGFIPVIMPNALKGIDYLEKNPSARAKDLKDAFLDDSIKAVICAIGGEDTYKLYPYLMEDEEFIQAVKNHPKIFTGFSDSTMNHLMFYKLGLSTFYGPCFLVDLAELDNDMLPYTKKYFEMFFLHENSLKIESSEFWYSERESYGIEAIGNSREKHRELHGYEVLNGSGIVSGTLYGGCIESIYEGMTFMDKKSLCEKYQLFPSLKEWDNIILFLETSDSCVSPEMLETMLMHFKNQGIFEHIKGFIVGKPMDEKYYEEYKLIYKKVFCDLETPILYNVNFGHCVPRCILPYGLLTEVDFNQKTITIKESILEERNY